MKNFIVKNPLKSAGVALGLAVPFLAPEIGAGISALSGVLSGAS